MSLTCIGNDKEKHEIGWIRGKRAYVAATTVCDRKMLPILQAMPKKPITSNMLLTGGLIGSGNFLNRHQLVAQASGGSRLNGYAIAPWPITQTSYSAWLLGGGDEFFVREGVNYTKMYALTSYNDFTINWTVTELKINGVVVQDGYGVPRQFSGGVTAGALNFRDDGNGLGVANAVDFLNTILEDYNDVIQTRFETTSLNLIVAKHNGVDNFSIRITENSIYHTSPQYYLLSTVNGLIGDNIHITEDFNVQIWS